MQAATGLFNLGVGTAKVAFAQGATAATDGLAKLAVGLGAYALASSAGNFGAGFSQLGGAITGNVEGGEQGAQASAIAVSVLGIGTLLVTKGDVNAAATAAQIEGIATVPLGMGLTGETPSLSDLGDMGQNAYDLIKKNPKPDMAKGKCPTGCPQ